MSPSLSRSITQDSRSTTLRSSSIPATLHSKAKSLSELNFSFITILMNNINASDLRSEQRTKTISLWELIQVGSNLHPKVYREVLIAWHEWIFFTKKTVVTK